MLPKYLLLSLLLSWLNATTAAADAAGELVTLLQDVDTFKAAFDQRIVDRDGGEMHQSSGEMTVARGNRFRWITLLPWEQRLVSDGSTLWQYDVELEQLVTRPFDTRLQETPGLLLAGDVSALRAQFEVAEITPVQAPDSRRFALVPIAADGLFARLEVEFSGPDPRQMLLVDSFGQRTEIHFIDGQRNTPVDAGLFTLEVPEGVDVFAND